MACHPPRHRFGPRSMAPGEHFLRGALVARPVQYAGVQVVEGARWIRTSATCSRWVCKELPALRAEISAHSEEKGRLLARIESEAAARRPILPLLAELLGTTRDETRQALGAGLPGAGQGVPTRSGSSALMAPASASPRPCPPFLLVCAVTRRTMRRQ